MTDLRPDLDDLAVKLLREAEGEAFATKLDAFKVVSQYHLGINRTTKAKVEEVEPATTFEAMKRRLQPDTQEEGTA